MKTVDVKDASLSACVAGAQDDPIMLTENGHPVALIYGLQDLDEEQLALCRDAPLWELIQQRRGQPTVSRKQLEQTLRAAQS